MRHVLLSILLLPIYLHAQNLCTNLILRQVPAEEAVKAYQNSHYKVVRAQSGKFGGQRITVTLWNHNNKEAWKMPHKFELDNAPPGNPQWSIIGLGHEISTMMGFNAYDANFNTTSLLRNAYYTQFPDRNEVNGFLKLADKKLKKKKVFGMPFQFYQDKQISSDLVFLQKFISDQAFPMSENNRVFYHDLNYHLLPLFVINEPMLAEAVRATEIFIEFAGWLQNKHPALSKSSTLADIYSIRAHQIDLLGNVSLHLKSTLDEDSIVKAARAVRHFAGYTTFGKSPYDYLADKLRMKKMSSTDPGLFDLNLDVLLPQFRAQMNPDNNFANTELHQKLRDDDSIILMLKMRLNEIKQALKD